MPTTPSSRRLRRAGAVAAALSVVALSAGCSLLPQVSHAPAPASTPAPASDAPTEVPAASAGATVTPADLGTLPWDADGPATITITGMHRVSTDLGIVSFSVTAAPGDYDYVGLNDLDDESLRHSNTDVEELKKMGYASGITLTVPGDTTVYRVATDGDDHCLCSKLGDGILQPGESQPGFAYVTLPAAATTVDVTIGAVGPFTGVPVS